MTYRRVIPRDLFNEADLLKCYGRLWICLERLNRRHVSLGAHPNECDPGDHNGEPFAIVQNPCDGSLTVGNVPLIVNGRGIDLYRPLNSRDPWPLWAEDHNGDFCERVFTETGDLSPEFLEFIG